MSRKLKSEVKPGRYVWIACEVKPGPFSNERMVKVVSASGEEWLGFVPETELKDLIPSGSTSIRALVIDVHGSHFSARLPGAPLSAAKFADDISRAELIA